jgi:hypothetical protein
MQRNFIHMVMAAKRRQAEGYLSLPREEEQRRR